MTHTLTLQKIEPVTHDTKHLVFMRPDGYDFTPGQATELALDRDGWREEGRPFTFVSAPDAETLEFIIKIYPDHDGVTEQIGQMSAGDRVVIGDAWGAIEDKGPGVFIAGGAGITPFIPILRARDRAGTLDGSMLIFSNKAERDIILRDQWEGMAGLKTVFTLTDEASATLPTQQIDKGFLAEVITDFSRNFYVCGPGPMIDDVSGALKELGANPDAITFEE